MFANVHFVLRLRVCKNTVPHLYVKYYVTIKVIIINIIITFIIIIFILVAVASAIIIIFIITSDQLQPDGCKLSVLLTFHINSTPIWRLGNLVSREASIDYTALGI